MLPWWNEKALLYRGNVRRPSPQEPRRNHAAAPTPSLRGKLVRTSLYVRVCTHGSVRACLYTRVCTYGSVLTNCTYWLRKLVRVRGTMAGQVYTAHSPQLTACSPPAHGSQPPAHRNKLTAPSSKLKAHCPPLTTNCQHGNGTDMPKTQTQPKQSPSAARLIPGTARHGPGTAQAQPRHSQAQPRHSSGAANMKRCVYQHPALARPSPSHLCPRLTLE